MLVLIVGLAIVLGLVTIMRRNFLLFLLLIYALIPIGYGEGFSEEYLLNVPGIGQIMPETLVALFLMTLMLARIAFGPKSREVPVSSIWVTWVFLLVSVLSAVLLILLGHSAGIRMVHRLFYPALAFLFIIYESPGEKQMRTAINLCLAMGVLISLWLLVQRFMGSGAMIWNPGGIYRLIGVSSTSTHAYTMGLLTILAYARMRGGGYFAFYLVLAGVFGLQVILTLTRGAIFATALALMAFEIFGKREQVTGRLLLIGLLLLGLISSVFFYEPLRERIFATQYRDVSSRRGLTAAQQFEKSFERSGRAALWHYIMNKVGKDYHLLAGYGVGRAEVDVMRDIGGVPHNEYLRVFYEMGIAGLLLFLGLLFQLWLIARAGVRLAATDFQKTVAALCLSTIILYTAGALVDNMINKYKMMGLFLYMFVAFVLVLNFTGRKKISTGKYPTGA